ncbi:RNA-directed DNA polymerase, eukaryota [Tanacetum coccineum]
MGHRRGRRTQNFSLRIINKKRSQLAIRGVFVNGLWCTDPGKVKEAFFNHFEARFMKHVAHRFMLNFPFNKRLSEVQAADLERSVSRDEIRLVVWNCGRNNLLPGSEGYSLSSLGNIELCTFGSTRASVLVNGSPSNEFSFQCGLKQGDPLSPYLFILIMESLHMSFSRVVDEGEWSDAYLKGIINILQCFFLTSGLRINIHKSQVLGVGISRSIMMQATSSIGCGVTHKQFCYLGVMVKTLSIGGRLTLLKSVLGASPLYNMSIFKVPKGVLKSMKAVRSNFFNGADSKVKKITWASWDKLLTSKKNGGLGVSSFHALNRALLLKWVWHFISQDGSLWF